MTFEVHNHRFEGTGHLHSSLQWPDILIEHRRLTPDTIRPVTFTCVGVTVALAGLSPVRRMSRGIVQRAIIQPGMAAIEPVGMEETEVEIASPIETLHIYLAPSLIAASALADYDADPARVALSYAGGLRDSLLKELGAVLLQLISRPPEPTDRLLIEGTRALLAAHLVSRYSQGRWRPATLQPSLPHHKLKRVVNLIESRLAEAISLDELAAEVCLSPYHFSRLFRRATGLSPHRYVVERRIQHAKAKLAEGKRPLVQIALEAGFGSQGNFNRTFRKHTGLTPGQFRALQCG